MSEAIRHEQQLPMPVARPHATLGTEPQQYLTFSLGGEMFAVGTLGVKEIIEYGQLTVVPMMPAFIRGVINLRGAVVPVIDLSARFGKAATRVTRRSCIVVIEVAHGETQQDIGAIVDSVNEVLEIPAVGIRPAPAFGAAIRTDFIGGMAELGGKLIILLDVGQVLSVGDVAPLAASAQAASLAG